MRQKPEPPHYCCSILKTARFLFPAFSVIIGVNPALLGRAVPCAPGTSLCCSLRSQIPHVGERRPWERSGRRLCSAALSMPHGCSSSLCLLLPSGPVPSPTRPSFQSPLISPLRPRPSI